MIKDTVRISLFQAINLATNLVLLALIARHLGVVPYGQVGFALAYAALAAQLIELGLGVSFVRAYSQARGRIARIKLFSSFITGAARRLLFAVPAAAAVYAMSFGVRGGDAGILASIGVLIVVNFAVLVVQAYRQAMDQYSGIATIYVASSAARAAACVFVLAVGSDLSVLKVLLLQVLVWLAALLASSGQLLSPLWAARNRFRRAARRLEHRPDDVRFGRSVQAFNLVSLVLNRLDYIVVKLVLGDVALGLYYFVQQLMSPIGTVFSSIVIRVNNHVMRLGDSAGGEAYLRRVLLMGAGVLLLCLAGTPVVALAIAHFLPDFATTGSLLPIAVASSCAAGIISLVNLLYNRLNMVWIIMLLSIGSSGGFLGTAALLNGGNVGVILVVQLCVNAALLMTTLVLATRLIPRLGA